MNNSMKCKHCDKEIIPITMFYDSPPVWYHKESESKYCNLTKAEPLEEGDAHE